MIFIDANIPMYVVGPPHPNKDAALAHLRRVLQREERLVTSAEVFQEVLHRYHGRQRHDKVRPAFEWLEGVVDEIFPIEHADIRRASDLLQAHQQLSARDALHVAVMQRRQVPRILSFDRGFDRIPGLERVA